MLIVTSLALCKAGRRSVTTSNNCHCEFVYRIHVWGKSVILARPYFVTSWCIHRQQQQWSSEIEELLVSSLDTSSAVEKNRVIEHPFISLRHYECECIRCLA